jgi:hypothetical protein
MPEQPRLIAPQRQAGGARTKGRFVRQLRAWKWPFRWRTLADLVGRVASQLPLDCPLPLFCTILGERWGISEAIASGKYRVPPAPTHRNRPVRRRSLVRISQSKRPCWLFRKYGKGRQNRSAMRQRVWHWIVSVTILAKLATSSRTLVRQIDGVAAGAALRLKILVSVVRFRPGATKNIKDLASAKSFLFGRSKKGSRR